MQTSEIESGFGWTSAFISACILQTEFAVNWQKVIRNLKKRMRISTLNVADVVSKKKKSKRKINEWNEVDQRGIYCKSELSGQTLLLYTKTLPYLYITLILYHSHLECTSGPEYTCQSL